jgi:hypothetical protein
MQPKNNLAHNPTIGVADIQKVIDYTIAIPPVLTFPYQAASGKTARRAVAKVEFHDRHRRVILALIEEAST